MLNCMKRLNSFDLFDTLITRPVVEPEDIFSLVGIIAQKRKLIKANLNFRSIREKAEKIARQKSNSEEIIIDEIYEELRKIAKISRTVMKKLMQLELYIEKGYAFKIAYFKNKPISKNPIIISDTYLPENLIKQILKANNIKYNKLYVSSKFKKTKSMGSLYRKILNDLKISPNKLHHLGDNKYSDFYIPTKYGIHAEIFSLSRHTPYEKFIHDEFMHTQNPSLLLLAGVMRSTRLQAYFNSKREDDIYLVGSNIIGPLLFTYTFWVLKRAKENKIDILYFVSRDGQILIKIARILNRYLNFNLKFKYMYASRESLYLPSITNIMELNRFIPGTKTKKLDKKIIHGIYIKRELLIKYLKNLGFDKYKRIGFVDINSTGGQQYAISNVLDLAGIYPTYGITGFYLNFYQKFELYKNDKFLSFTDYLKFPKELINGSLIESFAAADHNRCTGYRVKKDKIIPILSEHNEFDFIKFGLMVERQAVIRFTKTLLHLSLEFGINLNYLLETDTVLKLLCMFTRAPGKLVKTFGKIKHATRYNGERTVYLIGDKNNYFANLIFIFSTRFHTKIFNKYILWPEGNFSYYNHPILLKLFNLKTRILFLKKSC